MCWLGGVQNLGAQRVQCMGIYLATSILGNLGKCHIAETQFYMEDHDFHV